MFSLSLSKQKVIASVLPLLFGLILFIFSTASLVNAEEKSAYQFTQEDLVALNQPGIIRVVYTIKGEVQLKPFDLDLKTLKIKAGSGSVKKTLFDEMLTGTGFIISPTGYIITNAHVVSKETIASKLVEAQVYLSVYRQSQRLTIKEQEAILKRMEDVSEKESDAIAKEAFKYVTFSDLEEKITILNPESKGKKIDDFIKEGFSATVKKIDPEYLFNERDIALIKIDKENLPAINFSKIEKATVGDKVYVFGFPSTADINRTDFIKPTFTNGSVSSFKLSEGKEFSYIQTDAKVSTGSSGGPLFDAQGDITGVVTLSSAGSEEGDGFAFAIPIKVVKETLGDALVVNEEGAYQKTLKEALVLLQEKHCNAAIKKFEETKNSVNVNFLVDKFINPYIEKCKALIVAGDSIDSKWDEIKNQLQNFGTGKWMVVIASIALVLLFVIVIIFLKKRIKKEESQIHMLEDHLVRQKVSQDMPTAEKEKPIIQQSASIQQNPPALPTPQSPITTPSVTPLQTAQIVVEKPKTSSPPQGEDPFIRVREYVQKLKGEGSTEEYIIQQLKNVGWDDAKIKEALAPESKPL